MQEKEVIRRFEVSSLENTENTTSRFTEFYNGKRLHLAINSKAPEEVYEEVKESVIEK